MFKGIVITTLCLVGLYLYFKKKETPTDQQIHGYIDEGASIIDVRTPTEFNQGHLKGAINIPLSEIKRQIANLSPGETYITYCAAGFRSSKATKILKASGFQYVYNGKTQKHIETILNL